MCDGKWNNYLEAPSASTVTKLSYKQKYREMGKLMVVKKNQFGKLSIKYMGTIKWKKMSYWRYFLKNKMYQREYCEN